VTFVASTGDYGSNPANGRGGTGYPSTSSYVLAVGGTTINPGGAETGWSGSGGGISPFEAAQAWQIAAGVTDGPRVVPDVSMNADPSVSPVAIYGTLIGGWTEVGGTGESAPMWAGVTAIINNARAAQSLGPIGQSLMPKLYSIYTSANYLNDFNDITVGNNGLYSCGVGYDLVTGLGTPKVQNLVPAVAPLPFVVMKAADPSSMAPTTAQKEQVVDQSFTAYALD
jgi:kumamolisin